jgi:hypothetical protein
VRFPRPRVSNLQALAKAPAEKRRPIQTHRIRTRKMGKPKPISSNKHRVAVALYLQKRRRKRKAANTPPPE